MSTLETWAAVPLPWPDEPTNVQYRAAAAAVGIAVADQESVSETKQAAIDSVMGLLSARIEQYASAAPVAAKREAARRYHGYLSLTNSGESTSIDVGDIRESGQWEHSRAFRLSGAQGALQAWHNSVTIKTWEDD